MIFMYFVIYSTDLVRYFCFFFFNDTATTEIYTLSLHDALPISLITLHVGQPRIERCDPLHERDRKSTRLNSSHSQISYAVFCLKKKNNKTYVIYHIKKKNNKHIQNNSDSRL